MAGTSEMATPPAELSEVIADAKPSATESVERVEAERGDVEATADAKPPAPVQDSGFADEVLEDVAADASAAQAEPEVEIPRVEEDGQLFAGHKEKPTLSSSFARTLQALKDDGRELARLHHEAKERAAGRLPALGSLLDAEEELLEALVELRGLSPLLLVDGALGVGKSSLINALLLDAEPEDEHHATTSSASSPARSDSTSSTSPKHSSSTPPILLGRPGGRGRKLLFVRPPTGGVEGRRRCLEGRPSLTAASKAEANMRMLSEEEWAERLLGESVTGTATDVTTSDAAVAAGGRGPTPLILEDQRACVAWGCGLWLAEVDVQDGAALESQWVAGCHDAVCLVRAAGGGALGIADEARVHQHLEAGRQLLLIVNQCDVALDPQIPSPREVEEVVTKAVGSDYICGIHAVSLLRSNCRRPLNDLVIPEEDAEAAASPTEASINHWREAWERCQQGFQEFAVGAEQRRLSQARGCLARGREAFVHWCTQGAKVVTAATKGFQLDAENVRVARDIINRNIDAEYLAHVFSSVLVGKFDGMCAALAKLPAPDLGSAWGRHATRRAMEDHLRNELEQRLRVAMQESLLEVTTEMAKQEQPAFEEIRRVARRGSTVPWEAEVKKLELDLRPDQLQHFAMHFFGSLAVGVLSGLGAAALELIVAELMLGPVGIVAGVATFVAFGVQSADWPSVREAFVKQVRSRHVELVGKARKQLDFPGLCERRRRRILEQMDIILQRLLAEVAALSESASEFARCALVLQTQQLQHRSSAGT